MADWANLVANQWVTAENIVQAYTTGGFTMKSPVTASQKFMTKTEAATYLIIDPISGNNFVQKQEIISTGVGNDLQSQEFRRNNCPSGQTGTFVTYTVSANTYYAATKAAANTLALNDISANGQNYANDPSRGYCTLDSTNSVIVVDISNTNNTDICAYIDTPGISQSRIIAGKNGLNFFQLNDPASQAFILASDDTKPIRFEFNISKLLGIYPDAVAIPQFIFKIRGRQAVASFINCLYSLKYPNQKLIMTGVPGSYLPSVDPTGGPSSVPVASTTIPGGGDGTIGINIGVELYQITYTRSNNTVAVIRLT